MYTLLLWSCSKKPLVREDIDSAEGLGCGLRSYYDAVLMLRAGGMRCRVGQTTMGGVFVVDWRTMRRTRRLETRATAKRDTRLISLLSASGRQMECLTEALFRRELEANIDGNHFQGR